LLPFLGRDNEERRVIINTIGAVWEGNQVWFITAGGAIFAAWPFMYAAAFSGLYIALLLVLFAMFFRPVGFDYRGKIDDPHCRGFWDWGLFISGAVPALIFGIAFGNVLLGLPFHLDDTMRPYYAGSCWSLFKPFALLTGIVSLSMLVTHGAIYLELRTEGDLQARARKAAVTAGITCVLAFAAAGIWLALGIDGYRILAMPDPNSAFNPLAKSVGVAQGAWLDNYRNTPWTVFAPIAGFVGIALALWAGHYGKKGLAFFFSSIALSGIILTAGFSMFPFIMPSSTDPNSSLTLWD